MDSVLPQILKKQWIVFLMLLVTSCILYFPIINKNFAADDFQVIYRVGIHRNVLVAGFFRPLSDVTLYLNYQMTQFNPISYYLSNILIHAFCSFLIYCFCTTVAALSSTIKKKRLFSILSAVLFLTYPFHNESIAWVVGRASLIAAFFGIACLLVVVSDIRLASKLFFAGLFYFIGLLAYESIFPIPAIAILLIWRFKKSTRQLVYWTILFSIVLVFHFILRKSLSGVITGDYGHEIFSPDPIRYLLNLFKFSGRMFLPPMDNSGILVIAFILVICGMSAIIISLIKKNRESKDQINEILFLLMLSISLIVPITFSISTRTSEGDRLLYFPSMFLCMLFAHLISERIKSRIIRYGVITGLLVYNIFLLEINNLHWKEASNITNRILSQISEINRPGKKIILVNMPGEFKGAYIFRNGFEEAILLRNLDTSAIQVTNYVNHAESVSLPSQVEPVKINDTIYLGKSIRVSARTLIVKNYKNGNLSSIEIPGNSLMEIWYWNKTNLKLLRR